jgi:hypothetical protein
VVAVEYCWILEVLVLGEVEYSVGLFGLFILTFFPPSKDSEDNPQTLLFSATCPHWVFNVAKKYMKSTYEQVDLIGKKTQKTAVTVEVNDSFSCRN